jgi:hypothetical protein
MRGSPSIGLVVVAALLPCGCMVVPFVELGEEVESASVEPGEPFELRYQPRRPGNHRLWIDHSVEFDAWDFAIEGPLTVETPGGTVMREVDVLLNACDGPVDPLVRIEAGTTEWWQLGDRIQLSATVFAIDVPGREVGSEFVLRGEWTASDDTHVEALRLVVTD